MREIDPTDTVEQLAEIHRLLPHFDDSVKCLPAELGRFRIRSASSPGFWWPPDDLNPSEQANPVLIRKIVVHQDEIGLGFNCQLESIESIGGTNDTCGD